MSHSVSLIASVVAGLSLSAVAVSTSCIAADAPENSVDTNLEEQAVATKPLDVNFPDVQAQIEADLRRQQTQGFDEINAQFDAPNSSKQAQPDIATTPEYDANTNGQVASQRQAIVPSQASMTAQTPASPLPQAQSRDGLQPVAMVQMADGKIYPVYVAAGQNFDGNLAHAPDNAVAYLEVPAQDLSKQGIVMPLMEGLTTPAPQTTLGPQSSSTTSPVKTTTTKTITTSPQSTYSQGQGIDPAYSPKVKVYGNKTPTFIGTREETRNYINELRESGAYSYNVNAPSYDGGYGYYYQYGSGYYYPYNGAQGNYGYYQDTNGQWHIISGFRYDQSINNYVPIFQDYGSCVGPDCPVIIAPNYPNAGLPMPNPNPPQGPATGQPPAWGPPPSYNQGVVDPGFTHPGYQPRPPRPAYPHNRPTRPVRPDPVDPGFNHPFG